RHFPEDIAHMRQVFIVPSPRDHQPDPIACLVQQADPGHLEFPDGHDALAYRIEQLGLALRVEASMVFYALLRPLAFGDIPGNTESAHSLSLFVAQGQLLRRYPRVGTVAPCLLFLLTQGLARPYDRLLILVGLLRMLLREEIEIG